MKKFILLIALIIVAQASPALAQVASPELRLATEQVVNELNSLYGLEADEQLARLSKLSEKAENIYSQYQLENSTKWDKYLIERCLMGIAEQQQAILQPIRKAQAS